MNAKNLRSSCRLPALAPVMLLLLMVMGCDPSAVDWNLQLTANTAAAVRFDIVGINLVDKQDWAAVSVDDYWKPNNTMRANANRLTFEIVDRKITLVEANEAGAEKGLQGLGTATATVPRDHIKWKEWRERNAVGLVVIGDFPGQARSPDQRKRLVPLFKQYWNTTDRLLKIEIQDDRIQVLTPPSTKAAKIAF